MRFSTPIIAALSATALAAPNGLTSREVITTAEAEAAVAFAAQAADCNLFDCASVVASAVCIAAGIAIKSVPTVIRCVSGGADNVCGCAGCVPALGNFLDDNNVC